MTNRSKKYFHDKSNDYSKGILHYLREQQPATSISTDIAIEDIREWERQIEEPAIKNRDIQLIKYCPHYGQYLYLSLPMKEGECSKCFQDAFGAYFEAFKTGY